MIVDTVPTAQCKYWWPKYNNNSEILANAMSSDFYKRVRNSIKKNGIINPLMGILENDGDELVRVKLGNNRLIAARELGIDEVPMIMLNYEDEWKIHKKDYVLSPGDIEYEGID